jgi:hypothetical protein
MFKIVGNDIHITRGDIGSLNISAKNGDSDYTFKVGDVVRLNVVEKKDCNCVVLQKDVVVNEESLSVVINLEGYETKFGEVINKPKQYWYEVELNPKTKPQTIIGYDEDGAKLFTIYPEGSDKNE